MSTKREQREAAMQDIALSTTEEAHTPEPVAIEPEPKQPGPPPQAAPQAPQEPTPLPTPQQPAAAPAPDAAQAQAESGAVQQQPHADGTPPPGYLPYAAVQQERDKARQLTDQVATLQAQLTQLQTFMQAPYPALNGQAGQPPAPAAEEDPPLPDPKEDLEGYMVAANQRQAQQIQKALDYIESQKQQSQETNQHQTLMQAISAHEAAYAQAVPDYYQAFQHLVTARAGDYQQAGLNPAMAQQAAKKELIAMADQQLRTRQNPANMIYMQAQRRGYVAPQVPAPTAQPGQAVPAGYAQPAPAAVQPAPPVPAPAVAMQPGVVPAAPAMPAAYPGAAVQPAPVQPSPQAMAEANLGAGQTAPVAGTSLQDLLNEDSLAAGEWRNPKHRNLMGA